MTVESTDENRRVARETIDQLFRRQLSVRPALVVPVAAGDPTPFRQLLTERLDPRGKLLRRICVAQIDTRELKTAAHEMCMRVIESGQQQTLFRVDRARGWTSEFLDVFGRTDRNDAISVDRHCFSGWLRLVHRVDDGVDDDRVGYERGFVSVNRKIHKGQGYNQNQ